MEINYIEYSFLVNSEYRCSKQVFLIDNVYFIEGG